MSGLVEPENGTIHFKDIRIDRKDPEDIVAMGISHVPEWRRIFPELTVYENLIMGGFLIKEKDLLHTRMEEAYMHFPVLRNRKEQRAGNLSGGEQQMLAIARALMSRPRLLLLDEPSLGLAPIITKRIFEVIEKINREQGVTILLVEQNVHQSLRLSHRGYVLANGEILAEGTGKELLSDADIRGAYLGSDRELGH